MTPLPTAMQSLSDFAWTSAEFFLPHLAVALVILVGGSFAAKWAARTVSAALARTGHVDETARPALAAAARYGVLILAFVAALSQIGVQTASLLAALGAAGLAIGLALQGTLANIAAGIMLLWLRPFQVGDYIEIVSATPFAGTVKEIGLFACTLETYEGLFVFAPNSAIWTFPLRNHSRTAGRLVSFNVGFAPGADMERARAILLASDRRGARRSESAATRGVRRQSHRRRSRSRRAASGRRGRASARSSDRSSTRRSARWTRRACLRPS